MGVCAGLIWPCSARIRSCTFTRRQPLTVVIKASSLQRLLILSKRLHCKWASWLHCADARSILRSTCTTFWLKRPAVHQIGCWHFHWSKKKTSCAESSTSSAVRAQGSHHSYTHHTGLHSIYLRFRETSCKHLLLKCFTEVLEGEKKTFAQLLNSFW